MDVIDLYISKYEWDVRIFLGVAPEHAEDIIESLLDIACPDDILSQARKHVKKGSLDTGLTYSNKGSRQSVVVVGESSTNAQFLNSFEHELRHLVDDMADALNLPLSGEAVAYLTGDANLALYSSIHPYICCSRNGHCDEL